MWFQLKTLLTSILLLIALCFGANANFDALNRTDAKIIPVGSEQTGEQIKGGLEIVTVAVPASSIKTFKHLKTEGKSPNSTSTGNKGATNNLRDVPDGVSFGRNANQNYHVWRHVTDELGMSRQNIQNTIVNDLPPTANLTDGLNIRYVTVDGVRLQYNAFKLPDGTVNIGRIHEAN